MTKSAPTFDDVWPTVPGDGWLTEDEGRLLWDSAAAADGPILEVGCYKGRSTCLLAALGRPLYCVDPFAGFDEDDPTGERTVAIWARNVAERFPGCTWVTLYRRRVEDWERRPCGFAYCDGDHSCEGTLAQLRAARATGAATACVHDYADSGGGADVKTAIGLLGLVVEAWAGRMVRVRL